MQWENTVRLIRVCAVLALCFVLLMGTGCTVELGPVSLPQPTPQLPPFDGEGDLPSPPDPPLTPRVGLAINSRGFGKVNLAVSVHYVENNEPIAKVITKNTLFSIVPGTPVEVVYAEAANSSAPPVAFVDGVKQPETPGSLKSLSLSLTANNTIVEIVPMRKLASQHWIAAPEAGLVDKELIRDAWSSGCGQSFVHARADEDKNEIAAKVVAFDMVDNLAVSTSASEGCSLTTIYRLSEATHGTVIWVSELEYVGAKVSVSVLLPSILLPNTTRLPIVVTEQSGRVLCTDADGPTCENSLPLKYEDLINVSVELGDSTYAVSELRVMRDGSTEEKIISDAAGRFSFKLGLFTRVDIKVVKKRQAFASRNSNEALVYPDIRGGRFTGLNGAVGVSFTTPQASLGVAEEFPLFELSHTARSSRLEFRKTPAGKLEVVVAMGSTTSRTEVGALNLVGHFNRLTVAFDRDGRTVKTIVNQRETTQILSEDLYSPGFTIALGGTAMGIAYGGEVPTDLPTREVLFSNLVVLDNRNTSLSDLARSAAQGFGHFLSKEDALREAGEIGFVIYCPLEPASSFAVLAGEVPYLSPCYQSSSAIEGFDASRPFPPFAPLTGSTNLGNGHYPSGAGAGVVGILSQPIRYRTW